jgi:hypothetical protein
MSRKSVASQHVWMSALAVPMVIAGCATTQPQAYNPGHLAVAQVAQVGQICQNIMGLNPDDRQVQNSWPGDPDPGSYTNDYRGCIAALTTSLQSGAAAQTEEEADSTCRTKGLQPDTPAFAECVLSKVQSTSDASNLRNVSLEVKPFDATQGADSSTSEIVRREEQACAAVGLEPGESRFSSCLSGLDRVLTARQLNRDYRN